MKIKFDMTSNEFNQFVEKHKSHLKHFTKVGDYPILIMSYKQKCRLVTYVCQYKPVATGFAFTTLASKHTDVLKATQKSLLKQQNEIIASKDSYREEIVSRYDENF